MGLRLADKTLASREDLIDKLKQAGWKYQEQYISKPRKKWNNPETVGIFTRTIKNPKYQPEKSTKKQLNELTNVTELNSVTNRVSKNDEKSVQKDGGKADYGKAVQSSAPSFLPATLDAVLSVSRMRQDGSSVVLALDTEFYYLDDSLRSILSWQVAFLLPSCPDVIQQVVFISCSGNRLSLSFLVGWILEHYDFASLLPDGFGFFDYRCTRRYVYHTVNQAGATVSHITDNIYEAVSNSTLAGESDVLQRSVFAEHKAKPNASRENGVGYVDRSRVVDGYVNDFSAFNRFAVPVTILCHAGKADLTTFNFSSADDILPRLSDVQGGLVSLSDFFLHPPCIDCFWKFMPVHISVRDTMCYAPAGQKSLASLGNTVGIPKLDVSDDDKNHMLDYLLRDPVNFMEYAINDSVITLCFAGELWGYNACMPVTVSGAAVRAAVPVISDYFGISSDDSKKSRELYNQAFRGLHTVKKGLSVMSEKAGFIENSALEPVNDNARILQTYAKQAYKGGYNGSIIIGKFDGVETHDYDLENAYPTAMALVPDVDWSGDVIASEIVHQHIKLQHFHTPFDLMFGYIKFRFPDSVSFPCIPVAVNGSMIFPRSSDGLDGVYASAPEIYLALRLGADIWAEHVYVGEFRYNPDGSVSRSLLAAVKQLVNDRSLAQKSFGKKSLPDLLLKTAVNSLYGKTAQDLIDKETWNAFLDKMDNIGGSAMTSSTHACLTTSIVRCVLLASMNQLHSLGYQTFSVTTDGFISDAPLDVLNSLDLYGFSSSFRSSRVALTGDETMWSEKHHQSDLLNFTTRGNVSLASHGVCAHNSFVTGFDKDSYDDRLALMTVVLGRTGRCHCFNTTWTKFRRLAARQRRSDFAVEMRGRALSMDFDMKRKPVQSSFHTVYPVVEDVEFEIANFETEPYATVAEYQLYKKAARSCTVLRTEKDWALFFAKVLRPDTGVVRACVRHIADLDWSILFTCIMGYRLGLWDIPHLNEKLSVKEKVEWINLFNKTKKKFTENTWKDCRKQNRASQMLERRLVIDLLTEMQNWKPTEP